MRILPASPAVSRARARAVCVPCVLVLPRFFLDWMECNATQRNATEEEKPNKTGFRGFGRPCLCMLHATIARSSETSYCLSLTTAANAVTAIAVCRFPMHARNRTRTVCTSRTNHPPNQREWEKLAASVGGVATIAYWDTQGRSRPPRLLGSYEGTPTIRLFKPKRKPKTPGNNAEKTVVDYRHGERKASDLRRFLENQMPEFVERVRFGKEDYDRLLAKADRFGLPVALVFSSKAKTSTTTKWLSAEFRRRMLVVEVPPTDKNRGLLEAIAGGVSSPGESGDLPALYVVAEGKEVVKYGGGGFARRKLRDFLSRHALSEPVKGPAGGRQEEKKKKEEEAFSGGDEF